MSKEKTRRCKKCGQVKPISQMVQLVRLPGMAENDMSNILDKCNECDREELLGEGGWLKIHREEIGGAR